jgi:ABC-type uncharacterized transport system involved in gliding motility auxiliary subunit
MKMNKIFKSRTFRHGSVATATTVIVIAVIVALNMLVTSLSARYNLSLDLTANQIFGISEDTKAFLQNLEKDVQVYVLDTEQGFTGGGEYSVQANEVIQKYAQESPRVTVQYIDLVRNPTFAQQFPNLSLNTSSIVVASESKSTDLTPYDLYNVQTDQYYGGTQIVSSKAEQAMTSAMLKVTSDEIVKVVMLGGHDETPPEGLRALLDANSYEVLDQNLLTEEINPEAKILVLNAPMRDLTAEELTKLDTFLYNGGKLGRNLVYFAGDTQPAMPNLNAFLADWGIGVGESVVFETSLNKVMNMNGFIPAVDYVEEEYSQTVRERSLLTVVPYARPLTALFETSSSKQLSVILNFSETSGVVPADADETWAPSEADIAGPSPALIVTQDRTYEGTTLLTSSVAACGSALAAEQSFLQATSLGNGEFFLSVFNKLADRQDTVSIQAKTIGGNELGIQSQQVVIIGLLLAIVLPLAVLVCGTVVWLGRRHK